MPRRPYIGVSWEVDCADGSGSVSD
jgi:hypothetical protein